MRTLVFLTADVCLLFAADPWKDKKSSEWNDKDTQRVLTDSPWAKTVTAEMDSSRMGGFGGGMGGRGGGGMGGPGGGMGGPRGGGMEPPKITVRWESAAPVQEAAAKIEDPSAAQIADWAKEYYVVSMSGGRMMGGGPGGRRGQGDRPQPDPSRMEQMQERMLQATSLTMKSGESLTPVKLEMLRTAEGARTVFLFPRTKSITAGDKEVSFESAMGPMSVKAKFTLKDMAYQGQLSL